VLACFATYAVSLPGGFVWDDDTHLLDNPVFAPGGLRSIWFSPPQVINYWPVTFTSYWFDHALWGFDPLGYRVVNVLLHSLASVVLWRVLVQLRVPLAWLCAAVFALHPVNVESVAWIAQRKNVLSLLFFLCAAWSYLRFEASERISLYYVSLACHALAMLSKGAAAPFPAVILLLAWWQRGSITRRDLARSAAFFAVTAIASLLEFSTQDLVADGAVVRDDSFLARLVGSGCVAWFYLGKALVPTDLVFVYPRWSIDPGNVLHWVPLLAAVGVVVALFASPLRRRPWARALQCAVLFYGLLLSPVLGFFDIYYMRYSFVADHYQYLALIGVVAFVVAGGGQLLLGRWGDRRAALLLVAGVVLLVFALSSARLSRSYLDEERLWRDTLVKNPDAFLAHYNLAHLLERRDEFEEALHHYRETLRIEAGHVEAMNNLGQVLKQEGRSEEAARWFRDAIATAPAYIAPRNNLGVLQHRTGDHSAAKRSYEAALEFEPDNAVLHFNLARLLDDMDQRGNALVHYRRAAVLAPASPVIQRGLRRAEENLPTGGRQGGPGRR